MQLLIQYCVHVVVDFVSCGNAVFELEYFVLSFSKLLCKRLQELNHVSCYLNQNFSKNAHNLHFCVGRTIKPQKYERLVKVGRVEARNIYGTSKKSTLIL